MVLDRSMKENISNGVSDEDEMQVKIDAAHGVCSICKTSKKKKNYTTIKWRRFSSGDIPPKCRDCQHKRQEKAGWKRKGGHEAGAGTDGKARGGDDPIARACSTCLIQKTREHYSNRKWKAAGKGSTNARCVN
jgi:hypothetical protein